MAILSHTGEFNQRFLSKSKTFRVSFFGKPVAPVASSPLNEVEGPIKERWLVQAWI
jgi:hypothetical protein